MYYRKRVTIAEGMRFSSKLDSSIETWLNGLDLMATPKHPETLGAFNPPQDNRPDNENTNTLVVYFSMTETTDPNNMNTEEANGL